MFIGLSVSRFNPKDKFFLRKNKDYLFRYEGWSDKRDRQSIESFFKICCKVAEILNFYSKSNIKIFYGQFYGQNPLSEMEFLLLIKFYNNKEYIIHIWHSKQTTLNRYVCIPIWIRNASIWICWQGFMVKYMVSKNRKPYFLLRTLPFADLENLRKENCPSDQLQWMLHILDL